jgi:hypothetical protein
MDKKTVELKDLVGLHELTGVDNITKRIPLEWSADLFEDAQHLSFVLDGVTYTAIEDPSDGYRSALRDVFVSEEPVANTFFACKVLGHMSMDATDNILYLTDIVTGKVVLEIGTSNYDDWYPCFECGFYPENMAINQGARQ